MWPRQTNWKLRAAREQMMKEHAVDENRQLKKRVAANEDFVKNVKHLLDKQADAMVAGPSIRIALGDDGSRIYGMLRAVLDVRQHQLEASMHRRLQELTQICTSGPQNTAMVWRLKQLGRGISMDMNMSALLPFAPAEFIGIVSQYVELDKIQRIHDNVVEKVSQSQQVDTAAAIKLDNPDGSTEVDARQIIRRVVTDHGTLLMWESMSYWQTHASVATPKRALVRASGWTVIAPFCAGDYGSSSIFHCESSAIINSSDGSKLKKSDSLARGIISTIQNGFDR